MMKAAVYLAAVKLAIGGLIFALIITFPLSCKKASNSDTKTPVDYSTEQITVDQTGPVDVYLAGWRSAYPALEFATYCKNGGVSDLTSGVNYIQANSVAVAGTDVYIGGNNYSGGHFMALYWKNGDLHYLTDTNKTSYISSVAVFGNDIYFAGYESNGIHKIARYWKNGQSVDLTSGATDAQINSITVLGNAVYAAGWEQNGTFEVAKYWKNDVPVSLSDGTSNVEANSIAVWGDDVFVVGNEYIPSHICPECGAAGAYTALSEIWKNGYLLATAGKMQTFNAVTASNGGIYIAGRDSNGLCYFKNGDPVYLTRGVNEAVASAIALWGNDVYVAGYENINGHNVPTYWKNGIPVRLSNGSNNAYLPALFLQKQ